MVFNAMITLLLGLIKFVLSPIPNVAATPAAITSGATWVTDTISSVINVLDWVISPTLMAASVVLIVGVFTFEWAFRTIMFVVHKLPFLNIH